MTTLLEDCAAFLMGIGMIYHQFNLDPDQVNIFKCTTDTVSVSVLPDILVSADISVLPIRKCYQ